MCNLEVYIVIVFRNYSLWVCLYVINYCITYGSYAINRTRDQEHEKIYLINKIQIEKCLHQPIKYKSYNITLATI